ncbi:hypothetical protein [Salinicola socius]|uniref:Uncharacterized protein n=1 Tax=Salinicola socius TaxID=404433 RepID=A0A1Q8SUK0_9GAMM|nr:hypothetical protein [Salinicola socius]OLO05083.1 hypothetical protein BTW07_05575 [Salinicola socius]
MQTQRMIDRGARDAERQRLLGHDEWCRRFALRIHRQTGVTNDIASQAADAAWNDAENERRAHPAGGQPEPETAADDELTHWND